MTDKLKLIKRPLNLSSQSLEKFIKTQKNLSRPTPKLWSNSDSIDPSNDDVQGVRTLSLSHPILRILDKCRPITLRKFNQVHAQLIVSGLFHHSLAASRVVKKLCSSQSTLPYAVMLFDFFEYPDAFLCNTVIRSCVNFNDPAKALAFYYDKMVKNRIFSNNYTFPVLIKACADVGVVEEGEKIHTHVVKCGFELDLYVRNAMIHMYMVFARVGDARKVFELSSESDLVTWNTMIDGYVKNGEVGFARWIFDAMCERDVFSWNSMISGYVGVGNMEAAKVLFDKMGERDLVSWNCMIDGHARIGNVVDARLLFDQMGYRNVVSWNSILALYVRVKDYNECLRLFDRMMQGGDVQPNEATLVSVLTACAQLGSLDKGEWIHSYIKYNGKIEPDVLLSTSLLTMYTKCGAMNLAKDVFDEMPEKSVVSWNSMIMGYGIHGQGEKAIEMFFEMERSGVMPNDATFVCLLSACSHAGLVLEGWWLFDLMQRVYNIELKAEHYGCMVDLIGRAGLTKDSEELIKKIPTKTGAALWGALLSACWTHSNLGLGEIVAKRLIDLQPGDIGPYILLSNIYAAESKWDDVENVRKMMVEKGIQKTAGSRLVSCGDLEEGIFQGNNSVHKRIMMYSMLSKMATQVKLSHGTNRAEE